MGNLSVMIADDSAVYRKILSSAVEGTEYAYVQNTASNGAIALEHLKNGYFDVVLLDVNMPEMDGIETLKRIKADFPQIHVIMVSSTGGKNTEITIEALGMGALDFILKPLQESYERNMEIVKIHLKSLFAQIRMRNGEIQTKQNKSSFLTDRIQTKNSMSGIDLVVIASSTGGPVALENIIIGLSKNFMKPILLVQHMPPDFTKVLADAMDKKSKVRVVEAKEGDVVRSGRAIIAPGGLHMTLCRGEYSSRVVCLSATDYVNGNRPSADVLFKSVAKEYEGKSVV